MSGLTVDIVGFDKAKTNMQKAKADLRSVKQAIRRGALLVEGDAKQRAPVDTGALRASILAELVVDTPTETIAEVSPNVDYAMFVEYGTAKAAAQPFLRPALEMHRSEIEAAIERAIKDALS